MAFACRSVESTADVRIFGAWSFAMKYDYRSINGVPVAGSTLGSSIGCD